MKESLSKKEQALMTTVREEWIDRVIRKPIKTDEKAARQLINYGYKLAGLKNPIIVFVDSPLGCQIGAEYAVKLLETLKITKKEPAQVGDQVRQQVRQQVWDQVGDQVGQQVRQQVGQQVWDQVGDQVGQQVRQQVWDQVGDQVWQQVWQQVRQQVWDQVGDQVGQQVGDQVGQQVRQQVRQQVWQQVWDQVRQQVGQQVGDQVWDQVGQQKFYRDYGYRLTVGYDSEWVAFYEFFTKIKVINNKNFNKYLRLFKKAGIFYSIQLDGLCVVSRMPLEVHRDNENRLHNIEGPSVLFQDGWGVYSIHGVRFEKDLFEKVMNPKASAKDILSLDNQEQRMAVLSVTGTDKLIKAIKAKTIKKEKVALKTYDNNMNIVDKEVRMELYSTDFFENETMWLAVYECPSTGRIYYKFDDQKRKDAVELLANAFGQTREQYLETIHT